MKFKFNILGLFICATSLSLLISCGGDEESVNYFETNIQNYHKTLLGNSDVSSNEKPKIYLDFSDGMAYAFKDGSTNSIIIKKLASTFLTSCEWHGLGRAYPEMPIIKESNNMDSLFNLISQGSSYFDNRAPIDTALSKIAESNQDALLVTDFELYTNNNISEGLPYAKDAFKKWLDRGNSISFFYSKSTFHDDKVGVNNLKDKHVFYTVFTKGRATDSSIVSLIQNAFDAEPLIKGTYNRYDLSGNPYSIKTDYGTTDNSGIADIPLIKQGSKMIIHDDKLGFEAIEFPHSWEKMDGYFQNNLIKNNESFLSKLFLDASNNDAFNLKSLKVVVTDVSDNFEKYSKYSEAKSLESEIKMVFDPKKRDSVWSGETNKNKKIKDLYIKDKRIIQDEFKEIKGTEIIELFDVNTTVFEKDMARETGKKIELQTIFNKNYKKEKIKSESKPFIIRVDYVIDQVDANRSNSKLEELYPQLKNSIIAMFDNGYKPKGIIYSYYLKFPSVKK